MIYKCPVCNKVIKTLAPKRLSETTYFPFCSERCKLVDLGAWLDEKYTMVAEGQPRDSYEELPDRINNKHVVSDE